jgi:thiol:disulfide interchange protein DsbD
MLTLLLSLSLLNPLSLIPSSGQIPAAEEAFRPSAIAVTEDRLLLRFDIAPDTYMYKENLELRLRGDGVNLARFELPEGVMAEDEFFGQSEVYRGQMEVELPLLRFPDSRNATLQLHYQGCADIGICYPPQRRQIEVELMPIASTEVGNE